jgi:excisionase family DNA binding protein
MAHQPLPRERRRRSTEGARRHDQRTEQKATAAADLLAEPLLDANEAARLLHVPRSTLYELVRSRGLPHIKVGRALRFTRADLAVWIGANSHGSAARR